MGKKKEIINAILAMSGRYSPYNIFSDWIMTCSLSIQNSCCMIHDKIWQEREQLYISTIQRYTEKEQELAKNSPACLAGNFAVKEAVAKALGTGFRGFGPGDVEVLRDDLGKPYVVLYGGARKRAEELGVTQVHVSITDTKEMAAAVAVAEA